MPPASPTRVASSSASRLEWAATALLAANLAWTVCFLGGYRPEDRLISGWLSAASLAALLLDRIVRRAVLPWHPGGFILLPFVAYGVANVLLVSPARWLGWMDVAGWAQMAATFWVALNVLRTRGPRRFVLGVLAGLGLLGVVAACYQRFVDPEWLAWGRSQAYQFVGRASGTFGIPNSLAAFLSLLLPPALAFAVEPAVASRPPWLRLAAWAGCTLAAFGLLLSLSRGAWLALVVALAVWPLLDPSRTWRRRVALAGAIIGIALAAIAAGYSTLPSVRDRLDALVRDGGERTRPLMWAGAWSLFLDAPMAGTGAGSFNVLFERHRPAGFRDDPQWAHNDYLNTLSDYGAVGFLLAFVLPAAWVLRARCRRDREAQVSRHERAWGVGLLAFGLTLGIDFHLKLPALAMTGAVAMAVWCGRWTAESPAGRRNSERSAGRTIVSTAAIALVAGWMVAITPLWRAEALRYDVRRSIDALAGGRGEAGADGRFLHRAVDRLSNAVSVDPENGQAWADLSYVFSLRAREDPSATRRFGTEAEAAARQALARSRVIPEFWWRLGIALDMQGRRNEAGAAFAHAIELAPHHPLGWYYQAYHYSLHHATRALARPSLATCLRLDPGYAPAESLWEDLKSDP